MALFVVRCALQNCFLRIITKIEFSTATITNGGHIQTNLQMI